MREASYRNPAFSSTTQHSAFNVANKLAENPLRIQIYEQILVIGHPNAHANHMLLTDSLFSGYICGQTEVKLKIMAHGFCAKQAHFTNGEEFSQNSKLFGRKLWFFETNFSRNYGWSFSKFRTSCNNSKNWGIRLYPSPLGCSCINQTLERSRGGFLLYKSIFDNIELLLLVEIHFYALVTDQFVNVKPLSPERSPQ